MPAKSQAQRAFLNATKGHAWVKKHHFDNKGKLPEHVAKMAKGGVIGGGNHLAMGGTIHAGSYVDGCGPYLGGE